MPTLRILDKEAERFAKQAFRTLRKFEATLHIETGVCCDDTHIATRAECVLNLYDFWTAFCRNLFVISSHGGVTLSSGAILSRATNFPAGSNLIGALRQAMPRGRLNLGWEPNWGIPTELMQASRAIGCINEPSISAAVGASNSPSEHLRKTRNYYAHRNADTAAKAKTALNVYPTVSPYGFDLMLQSSARPGSSSLFEDWVHSLIAVAYASCS